MGEPAVRKLLRWPGRGRLAKLMSLAVVWLLAAIPAAAQENERAEAPSEITEPQDAVGRVTGLPIPRFVSLKKSPANARVGPGPNYPVHWVYLRAGLPVEITAEHNNWRRIRDRGGDEAWVYHALVDGRRTAIVKDRQVTVWRKQSDGKNDVLAYLDPEVIVRVRNCSEAQCRIEIDGIKGWVDRSALWGLYPDEFKD